MKQEKKKERIIIIKYPNIYLINERKASFSKQFLDLNALGKTLSEKYVKEEDTKRIGHKDKWFCGEF